MSWKKDRHGSGHPACSQQCKNIHNTEKTEGNALQLQQWSALNSGMGDSRLSFLLLKLPTFLKEVLLLSSENYQTIFISLKKRKKTPKVTTQRYQVTTQRYQASVWLTGLSPLLGSSLQSAGPSRGHAPSLSSCWCPSGAVGVRAISLLSCSGALWGGM